VLTGGVGLTPAADPPPIRAKMELVMGPLPGPVRKVPLDMTVIEETKLDGYVRKKLTFAAEKDGRVPAWLLVPDPVKFPGKRPAVLVPHQTIAIGKDEPVGLGTQESKRIALHLVRRGYVCLAPDYPSFGEYKYDFAKSPYASGCMKAIWNNLRAVDLLQSLPEVDPDRIAAIGHSLGGHTAMFTAAFDDRIKVIVSSCGFCSFHTYYKGDLTGWTSPRYMPRIASVYGKDPAKMPFDFSDIVSSFAPRAFLAVAPEKDSNFAVAGVREVMAAAKPAYENAGVPEKLKAIYPPGGHDFPDEARKEAYEFIDKWLFDPTPKRR
jgi:dipeptidyl aminopeptidase/acylaminoacyl peptidase